MKTIIQVWAHSYYNKKPDKYNNFFGIGDILRGTLNLYLYCREKNYNFVVDIHLHNLSNYIIEKNYLYRDLIEKNKDNIPFIEGSQIEKYINNSNEENIYFFTNLNKEVKDLDEESRNFMKNLLKPNENFNFYLDKNLITISKFNILHFRLGDNELVRNNINNKEFEKYFNVLNNIKYSENDILISDSISFKKFIKNKNIKIRILDTIPVHIGIKNDLKDTLLEFFFII